MRRLLLATLGLFLGVSTANATVSISVDLTHQRMNVVSAGGHYSWPISSGRAGYNTPTGVYSPHAMYKMTYSNIYNNAPMPHAIFFSGGYAIHGTYAVGALGSPASHGCIRLAPGNAAALFRMVQAEGARIAIGGSIGGGRVAASKAHAGKVYAGKHHRGRVVAARHKRENATKVARGRGLKRRFVALAR